MSDSEGEYYILSFCSKYNMKETTEQYYERCHLVTKEILKRHEQQGKDFSLDLWLQILTQSCWKPL